MKRLENKRGAEEKEAVVAERVIPPFETFGLKKKDYVGYALGDFAGCLCFSTVTTILQKYYTDILGLTPLFIMIMFILARVWDAINDPIMGRIVDIRHPGKEGRYRVWMKWVAIPLAISTILMFLPWSGLAEKMGAVGTMVYATITYIAFGMLYTVHQIPYGSLASVVTTDAKERNKLSVFRSAGAALGSIPVLIITMVWSKKVEQDDGTIVSQIQYLPIIIGVSVLAIISAITLFFAYKCNKERVFDGEKEQEKESSRVEIKPLLKNRNYVSACFSIMLLLAGMMFIQSFYVYLFAISFSINWMYFASQLCLFLPLAVMPFFIESFNDKRSVKWLCVFAGFLASFPYFVLSLMKEAIFATPFLFLPFSFISGIGISLLALEIPSLATLAAGEAIDKTGNDNGRTSRSIYSFFQKMGGVIAAIAVNMTLISIDYKSPYETLQNAETMERVYSMATLIPGILFSLVAFILLFIYRDKKSKAV